MINIRIIIGHFNELLKIINFTSKGQENVFLHGPFNWDLWLQILPAFMWPQATSVR